MLEEYSMGKKELKQNKTTTSTTKKTAGKINSIREKSH